MELAAEAAGENERMSQETSAGPAAQTVYVVDDDPSVRDGLDSLLRSVGYRAACFPSTALFLAALPRARPSCLVLDIRMPDANGLDFQDELLHRAETVPIIFLSGHGDVPMSVRAMKAGASEFLLKPFREQDLLDAIRHTLTTREREVMGLVALGRLNKQIAGALGLSEITVKVHRGHAMRKMQADTVADLIRMAESLGLLRPMV